MEHHGTYHFPSKYVNLAGKYFQLTKVAFVSHVNFNFESSKKVLFLIFKKNLIMPELSPQLSSI
jgi:hypothetical protein